MGVLAPLVITQAVSCGELVLTDQENVPVAQVVALNVFPDDPHTGLVSGGAITHSEFELTVTVAMHDALLLHWSIADTITVVVPIGKGAFRGKVSLRVTKGVRTPSQSSVALGLNVTVLVPLSQNTMVVDAEPQLTNGAEVSRRKFTLRDTV